MTICFLLQFMISLVFITLNHRSLPYYSLNTDCTCNQFTSWGYILNTWGKFGYMGRVGGSHVYSIFEYFLSWYRIQLHFFCIVIMSNSHTICVCNIRILKWIRTTVLFTNLSSADYRCMWKYNSTTLQLYSVQCTRYLGFYPDGFIFRIWIHSDGIDTAGHRHNDINMMLTDNIQNMTNRIRIVPPVTVYVRQPQRDSVVTDRTWTRTNDTLVPFPHEIRRNYRMSSYSNAQVMLRNVNCFNKSPIVWSLKQSMWNRWIEQLMSELEVCRTCFFQTLQVQWKQLQLPVL